MDSLHPLLIEILDELKLDVTLDTQQKLLAYLDLLDRWNQTYNLTAISSPYDRMIKHIADSLAVAPYLQGDRWLDVGSGAGLPGIPLALVFPHQQWTLLDKNGKKTRFLIQAKAQLALTNVQVIQSDVMSLRANDDKLCGEIQNVICRAWTNLPDMIASTQHLYSSQGYLWAMKGAVPLEELQSIQQPYEIYPLQVPKLSEQRHLIRITMEPAHE